MPKMGMKIPCNWGFMHLKYFAKTRNMKLIRQNMRIKNSTGNG